MMSEMRRKDPPTRTEAPAFGVSSHDRLLQAAKTLFAARGYDNTSTVAIARTAGTSESQLMKHFGSKEGLLEAIFDEAWQKINWNIRQAIQGLSSPSEKLALIGSMVMSALDRDADLRQLMLLDGRRVRKEGRMVALSQGYLEFVRLSDEVLGEMRAAGKLRADLHPEGMRSALFGMVEGLMRDQLLARRANFPAQYSAKELRRIFNVAFSSFLVRAAGEPTRPT